MACNFQATIGGKFVPIISLGDDNMNIDTMIIIYNTAMTDTASEIPGKESRRKKTWVTPEMFLASVMTGGI